MDGILNHQARAIILAVGIVMALCGYVFFNSAAIMLPAVPLTIRFMISNERAHLIFGTGVMTLFLFVTIFGLRPVLEIKSGWSGFIILGGLLLMLFGFIHFLLSPKGSRSEAA